MRVHKPHYRPDDYLVRCDRSGFRRYASETQKEWNGLRVRNEDWEPRHPQDFVRGRADEQKVPDARPGWTSSTATFIDAWSVNPDTDY